jgi:mono/diheme cytochrome c family protein
LSMEVLENGPRRFNIYCSPCHDRTGSGRGIVALRSQGWIPASIHDDRVRQMVDGELFNVATYGRRSMPGYRHQITVEDRWAIVAYLRALQRTRMGTLGDVPPELQRDLR